LKWFYGGLGTGAGASGLPEDADSLGDSAGRAGDGTKSKLDLEEVPGPAIMLQADSTTVVPPGCTAQLDASGAIIIRLPAARKRH